MIAAWRIGSRGLASVALIWLLALAGLLAFCVPATLAAGPPMIEEEWSANVSASGARIWAKINPEESETSYRFEYGTTEAYGTSIPIPDGRLGAGTVGVSVSVSPLDLSPATTYHYRVVAIVPSSDETFHGADETFTTQSAGEEFLLPDGRQWELVSPPNKHGAGIEPMNTEGGLIQAAAGGGAFTYVAIGPTESNPAGNTALEFTQLLSTRRSSGGWESQDIVTPHNAISFLLPGHETEYLFFSSDLSQALVAPEGETPLPPLEEGAEKTIYVRDNSTCGEPDRCFVPLVTKSNVQPGVSIGPGPRSNGVGFMGATPDLSHMVLESPEALTANAVKDAGKHANLYEWADGELQLVSILPPPNAISAAAENQEASLGYEGRLVRNAISDDGSRIVWEGGEGEQHHLYLRDMTSGETVQMDVPQAGVEPGTSAGPGFHFQAASADDGRVFFTDEKRLTLGSHATVEEPDLYVFEPRSGSGPLSGTITDLTVGTAGGESAAVQGEVLGVSEDGSYVYFVANGALAEHAVKGDCRPGGTSGLCNLYVDRYNGTEWQPPVLVAVLSSEDEGDWVNSSGNAGFLGTTTSRVSPNGEYVAFMSGRPLTKYDNLDAASGVSDQEVYLYHAMHGGLVCASCDPTGARPVGVFDPPHNEGMRSLLVDHTGAWGGHWLAGSVPGWTPVSDRQALYQSRYLSNNGRLFFDSPDALVPADVSGVENVYEYEPEGLGSCSSASGSAGEVFDRQAGGCVALISSGTASEESAFLDAGEGGGDVFFMTTARLSGEDVDSAFDVYDAHQCTSAAPCPSPPVALPPCTTTESCRGAATLQPEVFGAPASATFSGEGNVASKPAAAKHAQKPKAKRRRHAARRLKRRRRRHGHASSQKRSGEASKGGQ
jgi:hypothetical protein